MAAAMTFLRYDALIIISKSSIYNNFQHSRNVSPFSLNKFHCIKTKAATAAFSGDDNTLPEFRFKDYMASKMKQVNEALDQTVPLQHPTQIQAPMRYSLLLPGKRFRPVLCLASCELVGGDDSLAMPIACAIEMIQTMSLMHDDLPCIDNDDLRRGMRACHKVFGEEAAILAGVSLLALAFQHIAEKTKNVSAERVLRAIIELASATGFDGLMGGQLLDVRCEGKEVSLGDVEYIHLKKAGKLIEASAVCGAIMGGGNDNDIERMRKYAKHTGLMCQVVDDILGLTKTSEQLGKTPGKDLDCDKATYPKLLGIEGARKCVGELMTQAMEELSYFDAIKAYPLHCLLKYIVNLLN